MEGYTTLGALKVREYGSTASIGWLNRIIKDYTNLVYGPFGFSYFSGDKDIDVMGMVINTKYIDLMANNRRTFEAAGLLLGATNEADFFRLMQENLRELYHYEGKYFKVVLDIIIKCVRKGNLGEKFAVKFMHDVLYQKTGKLVDMIDPTLEEDISGIDSKFEWDGRMVSVQVKPFDGEIAKDGKINAHSQGSLSIDIKSKKGERLKRVDYLALYNLKSKSAIIVRGDNVEVQGNYFVFPEDKVISRK